MNSETITKLEDLKKQVIETDISEISKETELWGGADVIICEKMDRDIKIWLENQPIVISSQMSDPRRRAVITNFAKELSWLFYQLKKIFSERIDYSSKYDFYGLLAQSAMEYLEEHEGEEELTELLLRVIDSSRTFK